MSGTRAGGLKASITNKEKFGEDFYSIQGAKGGRNSNTGGFAKPKICQCDILTNPHFHSSCAGVKGGRISSRKRRNNE